MNRRYKKVVKWDTAFTDKTVLLFGLIFMIPIVGQVFWIVGLVASLLNRKVYFEEVKE